MSFEEAWASGTYDHTKDERNEYRVVTESGMERAVHETYESALEHLELVNGNGRSEMFGVNRIQRRIKTHYNIKEWEDV